MPQHTAASSVDLYLKRKRRRGVLFAMTGLVLAYTRNFEQHGQYGWDSTTEFFATWFVHYLVVLFGGILFVVLVERWRRFFLDESVEVKTDTGLVYWCLAIVWGCTAVFVFGHWGATPDDLY